MNFRPLSAAVMCAVAAASLSVSAAPVDQTKLPGWTEGAEVIRIEGNRPQIDMISGVIYSQVKGYRNIRQLRMTFEIPRTKEKKPAVIYFPGGGFSSADHEKFSEMRRALAEAGFVVAAAEYRVVPNKFPALLEDAKAAVRFVRAHAAEYGVDPDRIAVLGDSAGGYLAEITGTTNGEKEFDKGDFLDVSSDVQAVVSIYGISDMLTIGEGFPEEIQKVHESPAVTEALLVHGVAFNAFPGASIMSDKEKAMKASALGHVDGSEPPFLILHGAQDKLVSPEQSAKLYRALKAKNVPADYILVENAAHGDLPWYQEPIIRRVVDWCVKTLKPAGGSAAAGNNL
ncbi:alpha/beta hydrolase [Sutterella sp.]|uniref:alpha/beta hydrolase n=1 Tax=Sutterella sp. TaxID=1981025 RepID=UPI0026DF8209|nr:alpha/beta hydrolase [Sutterella sp.]MDO5532632.1 alpha/beta hydrolase [Sutterella sp.]